MIVALFIAVGCAYSPAFSAAIYSFGVDTIGVGIVTNITGAFTGIMAWGATGLAPAVGVFAGTIIFAVIMWTVLLRRYIWPKIKGVTKPITTVSSKPLQGGLVQTGNQAVGEIPVAQVVVEEKKE